MQKMKTDFSHIEDLQKHTHHAMATVFELYIQHADGDYAEKAAWEVFKEIDRLEQELSRFIPNSEISRINNSAPGEKVILSADTFECLRQSIEMNRVTMGAFDITYAKGLKRNGGNNLVLHEEEMSAARADAETCIDLGGIGKGYAVEKAEEILKEWGLATALMSGGFSSVKAVGAPEGFDGWPVSISNPINNTETLLSFLLKDSSISGSGIKKGMHIIDPLTGQPAMSKTGSWAIAKSAIVSEALSTAFIILDNDKVSEICGKNDQFYAIILNEDYPGTDIFITGESGMIRKLI